MKKNMHALHNLNHRFIASADFSCYSIRGMKKFPEKGRTMLYIVFIAEDLCERKSPDYLGHGFAYLNTTRGRR